MNKKLAIPFLWLIFAATISFGQSPSKIISQANKSLGGEKLLKSVTSWRQIGTIKRISDGATGRYEAIAAAGGLYAGTFDFDGFEYAFGYNGKSGWTRDSRDGLRTVTGDASKDFQAEALYRTTRWLRASDEKAKLSSGGTSNVNGKPANIVLMTTAKSVRLKLYFDAASGLLLREDIPAGPGVKTFEYSDYRMVNGIRSPFSIQYSDGFDEYAVTLDEIIINRAVPRSSFDFPKVSGEPLPDIPQLLNDIRKNADRVAEILENYSYTELRIDRDLNSKGDFVEKSSEKRLLTFYKGNRISRKLEKNGKPLSLSDQAKEDKDVEKQVNEIEKRIAEREKRIHADPSAKAGDSGQSGGDGKRITIADALKGSVLINPRPERLRGRSVIVFDYEPNPAFKPNSLNEKIFSLCNGAVWVDVLTKQVIRLDAVLTQSSGNFLAKAKRGASFSLENELVNNEIWLPSQADVNLSIKILFAGININNLIKYGDYRRFETEVNDVKVGGEVKP